ncbi:hypothetical protein [Streptomyces sp. NRRL F-5123]|uniref:hypothetical protein n=1 Tax=Streptomyces sp. NRRL F-5123 TaxID=1463856 RepID=UPI0004E1F3B9|nr:hypothetical protein [Streptomyces sp. NRRL F-5123]
MRPVTADWTSLPFLVPVVAGCLHALRYLAVRRAGETLRARLRLAAHAPLAIVWNLVVLRVVRWYAIATCARTGWGTRTSVETVTDATTTPI